MACKDNRYRNIKEKNNVLMIKKTENGDMRL